jgi:hypothetical protein
MNWKVCGRNPSWPNLRYKTDICLQELSKTTKHLIQDSWSPGRDLKPGPPEYEAGVYHSSAMFGSNSRFLYFTGHLKTSVEPTSETLWF